MSAYYMSGTVTVPKDEKFKEQRLCSLEFNW